MILFLLAAVVLYLVVPSGLVVGSVAAAVVGAAAGSFALLAIGPGVYYGARLTGSPGRGRRWLGWTVITGASLSATAAAGVAVLMALLVAGATYLLPTFLPFS